MMFIAADLPGALSGLSRKLPHYHKYSYLVFEGAEPANAQRTMAVRFANDSACPIRR
jgi:hypothetical protein